MTGAIAVRSGRNPPKEAFRHDSSLLPELFKDFWRDYDVP